MILLLVIARFFLPSNAGYSTPLRTHVADALRLKCDELPYRTVYVGTRCYVAVAEKVKYSDAPAQCSSIFSGSTVATDVPTNIFKAMMLEESQFHTGKDSSGAKQVICVQDTGYICDKGKQSTVLPGKCFERAAKPMNFENAQQYCKDRGMEVPQIDNDLDNQVVRGALLKDPAWIQNIYMPPGQWKRQRSYSKFSTCDRPQPRLWAGSQMKCNLPLSSVIDNAGYWGNSCQKCLNNVWDVICVKDAVNNFTERKKKPVACIAHHKWDEETEQCEWTGPKDACIQVIGYDSKTFFMTFPNFPQETYHMHDLYKTGNPMDNNGVKVVVRKGCMFTGYAHCIDDFGTIAGWKRPEDAYGQDWILVGNLLYGEHVVPSQRNGMISNWLAGLTRMLCFCDPTEATINDHVPAPPPRKKCIEHHEFNETTQSCEWIHDPKYCAELITYDGRRQKVEIPNWPANRKYDVHHWNNLAKRAEDFHVKVTDIIVRQHCWATLLWGRIDERMTLKTSGYGKYQVASLYNSMVRAEHDGTHRVVCECIR